MSSYSDTLDQLRSQVAASVDDLRRASFGDPGAQANIAPWTRLDADLAQLSMLVRSSPPTDDPLFARLPAEVNELAEILQRVASDKNETSSLAAHVSSLADEVERAIANLSTLSRGLPDALPGDPTIDEP